MVCRVNKQIWATSYFVGIGVEPCSPPAKGTAGDDLVFALCHKLHVTIAVFAFVPINEVDFVFSEVEAEYVGILLRPLYAARIAEDEEYRIVDLLADKLYATLKVAEAVAIVVVAKHITAACVDGDRITVLDESLALYVAVVGMRREGEGTSHLVCYALYSAVDEFERQSLACQDVFRGLQEVDVLVGIGGTSFLVAPSVFMHFEKDVPILFAQSVFEGLLSIRVISHDGMGFVFKVSAKILQLQTMLCEGFLYAHRPVPVAKPKFALPYVFHNVRPLFYWECVAKVWRVKTKDTFQLIAVPLADDVVAFRDVIYQSLDKAFVLGICMLKGEILAVGEHLIAKTGFNMDYVHNHSIL